MMPDSTKRKYADVRQSKPHPPEIGNALAQMSQEDRTEWVTMACITWGDHANCSGQIHDDSDMPAGKCKCPCHITIPRLDESEK